MKMMKKLLTCSLGVMLGVGMLASCTTPTDPTTANPTTQTPSTVAPSTQDPSSEAPSTQDPSSEAPSTQAPSTQDPSSEAPSTQAPSTETPSTQPDPIPTKTYYAEIEPSWTEVYAYAWEGPNSNTWPGAKMSNVSENIYSIELDASYTTIIFNNNNGSQTVNIGILDDYNAFVVTNNKSGEHYTANYATYENGVMTPAQTKPAVDFYVIGSHSSWGPNDSYKLTRNQDGTEATITVPLATGTEFKITNGSWNPEFNAGNVTLPSNLTTGEGSNIKVVEGATFTFTVTNPDEDNRSLTITSVPAPKALPKTVAEARAYTAESNVVVEVEGVVQNVSDTTYGTFYLVDPETKDQILVYGLSTEAALTKTDAGDGTYTGAFSNNKTFASLNVAEGDYIKMHAVVAMFSNKPQIKGVLVEETTWTSGDYTVTLPEGSAEGTVDADKASYKYGETVTLTITPAEGYKVDTVKVNHGHTGSNYSSNYVPLTESAANTYTFSAHLINNVQVTYADATDTSETVVVDFAVGGFGIGTAYNTTAETVTIGGITYEYFNVKQNSGYLMLNKGTGAYFANTTAIPGKITSVVVEINAGSSGTAKYYLDLYTEAKTGAITSTTTRTGAGTLTLESTVENGYSFFNITLDAACNKNGQIKSITIVYEPAA